MRHEWPALRPRNGLENEHVVLSLGTARRPLGIEWVSSVNGRQLTTRMVYDRANYSWMLTRDFDGR